MKETNLESFRTMASLQQINASSLSGYDQPPEQHNSIEKTAHGNTQQYNLCQTQEEQALVDFISGFKESLLEMVTKYNEKKATYLDVQGMYLCCKISAQYARKTNKSSVAIVNTSDAVLKFLNSTFQNVD
ncbi:hypothetical protein JQC92_08805 [Shewanella sp. 202IG2-18]|uniref:hypothetical protein n=1 Tax=Parashewanella hymeniacidonis TaxID=2807618 RepID=UPI001961C515|nr:hypothetical protein [Parashewanella hymeniacidonis]MBM7072127.1 hypothetical protein [Parashewanella hymeniacidonis]